jgi:translation initiation factor 4G
MQVPAETRSKDEPEYNFRKLLVNRCQMEFEKNSVVELDREARVSEIEQTADPVSKNTENSQACFVIWCGGLYLYLC